MEKQININFEPVSHTYSDDTGLVYTSATTLVGKYKEPFNKRYWSMYTALRDSGFSVRPTDDKKCIVVNKKWRTLDSLYKNPINTYEVTRLVDEWKRLTEEACARGNKVHDYLEDSINESKDDDGSSNKEVEPQLATTLQNAGLTRIRTQHDLDKTTLLEHYPAIYTRLLAFINMGCVIFAEKRIYTQQYQIAGMIDVLIVKGKQFCILDWKTNKDEMLFQSGYFKKQKIGNKWVKTSNFIPMDKRLFAPIDNLQECKGMIYSLQLSLYAFIMELWGYTLVKDGLEIFHMRPNLPPKLIKIRYLKAEVQAMLTHHLETRVRKKESTNNIFGIHG